MIYVNVSVLGQIVANYDLILFNSIFRTKEKKAEVVTVAGKRRKNCSQIQIEIQIEIQQQDCNKYNCRPSSSMCGRLEEERVTVAGKGTPSPLPSSSPLFI